MLQAFAPPLPQTILKFASKIWRTGKKNRVSKNVFSVEREEQSVCVSHHQPQKIEDRAAGGTLEPSVGRATFFFHRARSGLVLRRCVQKRSCCGKRRGRWICLVGAAAFSSQIKARVGRSGAVSRHRLVGRSNKAKKEVRCEMVVLFIVDGDIRSNHHQSPSNQPPPLKNLGCWLWVCFFLFMKREKVRRKQRCVCFTELCLCVCGHWFVRIHQWLREEGVGREACSHG